MAEIIPIENIYYMLCYSWVSLKEKDLTDVKNLKKKNLPNLFARVLNTGLNYLIKKGFDREYVSENENISSLRGKLLLNESINKLSWMNGKMFCEYDELSYDILQNRILKSTIYKLLKSDYLEKDLKTSLIKIYHHFNEIKLVDINATDFQKIKIHRNNSYYGFLINICKIIHENLLPSQDEGGKEKFSDFLRNEKEMAYVFENFVRNFYKYEQKKFRVRREDIQWNIEIYEGSKELLPKMQTDITLENKTDKIIIDTKYYKNAMKENFNKSKFNSSNFQQISSYLTNVKNPENKKITGILIYPQVEESIDFSGKLNDSFEIKVKT
ncbi:MAG: restriction endonuclease, partial [Candidatus Sericytochromatia bacterium]|nr:restriction endonuclease [Candidatus Sericytochromatia bacterium]